MRAAAFAAGALSLVVTIENGPAGYSAVLVDGLEVSWLRSYEAVDDSITYPAEGPTTVAGLARPKTSPIWS